MVTSIVLEAVYCSGAPIQILSGPRINGGSGSVPINTSKHCIPLSKLQSFCTWTHTCPKLLPVHWTMVSDGILPGIKLPLVGVNQLMTV